eukprot:2854749-Pyramimonas_sp.AAC.1
MEGGPFSECDYRFSAAHTIFKRRPRFRGWKAARFQNEELASAPRIFVFEAYNRFKQGRRCLFNMWLSQ